MGMTTEPASGIWREDLIENQVRNEHTGTNLNHNPCDQCEKVIT